ncbi:hypothetical protein SDC9_147683 [bioreactor metagenome]|uniref:Uncharacterized protein n=1 Tax=bioreactor metagenome TaxID=1076179 RepID=A0A645EEP9_9ZZZZ
MVLEEAVGLLAPVVLDVDHGDLLGLGGHDVGVGHLVDVLGDGRAPHVVTGLRERG